MKKRAIFWLREDFRILNNQALANACENHDEVLCLFIFNPKNFINKREAQQWWLAKSLDNFKTELEKLNINLEIQIGDEIEILSKIKTKDNLTLYWNKIYEPDVINLGKEIRDKVLLKNKIDFKYFKGNILNEFQNVTKKDLTPFKVFTPFWRIAEQVYINSVPTKKSKITKRKKAFTYFKDNSTIKDILPKKKWYKKFEKYWEISEKKSHDLLNDLIRKKINKYGTDRDIPSINGTSKLSPYIRYM